MSLHRLGRSQEAEATLAKLRHLFENGRNAGLRQYLIEAEQLFAVKDSNIWKAWNCIEAESLDQALELLSDLSSLPVKDDPNFSARVQSLRRHLSWLYFQRSRVQEHTKVYDEAISNYESAVKANPDYVLAYNNLAWLLVTCPEGEFRDGVKAVQNATKACELTKWDNAQYVDTLAAAYAEAGDFDEAIKWQQKAIDLLGEEERSRYQLAFKAKMGLYQGRQTYYGQYLFGRMIVARWTFDQVKGKSVLDSSGNKFHGKLVGDAHIVLDPERGNVLSLDGDGDYVDCGNSMAFNITREMTVACWIKVHEFNKDWQSIIRKGSWSWRLQRNRRRNNIEFACTGLNVVGEGRQSGSIFGKVDVNDGKWHHVAGVYDGNEIYLYVDGTLDNSERASGLIETNDFAVMIGENAEEMGGCWNGMIDDVRIYSYALSEAEIKEVYAGRGPGPNKRPD
jgi:hypothetical protein